MGDSSGQVHPAISTGIICFLLGIAVTIGVSKYLGWYDAPIVQRGPPGFGEKQFGGPPGGGKGGKGFGKGGKGFAPPGTDKGEKDDKGAADKNGKDGKDDKGKGDAPNGGQKGS